MWRYAKKQLKNRLEMLKGRIEKTALCNSISYNNRSVSTLPFSILDNATPLHNPLHRISLEILLADLAPLNNSPI